jgi:hypothetical protein
VFPVIKDPCKICLARDNEVKEDAMLRYIKLAHLSDMEKKTLQRRLQRQLRLLNTHLQALGPTAKRKKVAKRKVAKRRRRT